VLFAQRLLAGPVPLRQNGSVLDLVIAHADAFTLREATRQRPKAELPSPPHSTAVAPHGLCTAQQVQVVNYRSLLKFSAWTV